MGYESVSKGQVLLRLCQLVCFSLLFVYNWLNNYLTDFTKHRIMYVIGAFQLVFTPFILFYNMTLAKYIHICKYFILMPLRFKTFKDKKWHYYMLEFCYYAGFLLNLFIIQERFLNGIYNHYFISVYTFASGPLMFAIYLNKDKLFLHSLSNLTTTYIHMTPALMVWGLRWHNKGQDFQELYPIDFSYQHIIQSYIDMLKITMPLYLLWAVSYYICMFVLAWDRIYEKDNMTMYRQFAEKESTEISKYVKTIESQYVKGLLYLGTHLISFLITSFIAIIMFNDYYVNTIMVILAFISINWFGSYKLMKAVMFYENHRKMEKQLIIDKSNNESKNETKDKSINGIKMPVKIKENYDKTLSELEKQILMKSMEIR